MEDVMSKFKVGDKVRRISNSFRGMTVGDTAIIKKINVSGNLMFIEYRDSLHNFRNFELVSREFPLEVLIKRANMGTKVRKELEEKHKDNFKITNKGEYIQT
jgi:hypothetical protein